MKPGEVNVKALSESLRRQVRYWSDLSWALDSALSGQRKAETDYRANAFGQLVGRYVFGGKPLQEAIDDGMSALENANISLANIKRD